MIAKVTYEVRLNRSLPVFLPEPVLISINLQLYLIARMMKILLRKLASEALYTDLSLVKNEPLHPAFV